MLLSLTSAVPRAQFPESTKPPISNEQAAPTLLLQHLVSIGPVQDNVVGSSRDKTVQASAAARRSCLIDMLGIKRRFVVINQTGVFVYERQMEIGR